MEQPMVDYDCDPEPSTDPSSTNASAMNADGVSKSKVMAELIAQIPYLRRYARILVGSSDQADDLVQDCLVKAMSRIDRYRADASLRAWLYAILRNVHLDSIRRDRRRQRPLPIDGWATIALTQPSQLGAHLLRDVQRGLEKLSAEHRETLLLIAVEGLTYEQAATLTGVPVGTVRSRLFRARKSLERSLEHVSIASTNTGVNQEARREERRGEPNVLRPLLGPAFAVN